MAAQLGKIALTLGTLLVSGSLFAHSHGHQMTEAEQKAANGVFEDKDVMDRTLSDWDGTWQSVYPFLLDGSLDPVFEKKAQKGEKSAEEMDNWPTYYPNEMYKEQVVEEMLHH